MKWITPEELATHIYGEIVDEVTRLDKKTAQEAIDTAIEEASGYLVAKYDTAAIFADVDNRSAQLLNIIKDIAVWHLIALGNPNIEIEFRELRYDNAIKWLDKVQRGVVSPQLPLIPLIDSSEGAGRDISWDSNVKRRNHY